MPISTDRIVVTASGIITALGRGMAAQTAALREARHGLRHPSLLHTVHAADMIVGEVRESDAALAEALGLAAAGGGLTRTALLAMTALGELLANSDAELLRREPLAFINANTVGGMSSVENLYGDFIGTALQGDFLQYIDTLDCAESTERAARHFGLRPFMATISTACSSSGNALITGARLIRQGLVRRAICGGCDALSRFTVNGFHSLKNVDRTPCRPFDQHRNGLNLGEGAAYLLLEKESDALARGADILAVFSGYSNSNDAYHPTAPSPDGTGAFRAMELALASAALAPGDIGYINAHGTATLANDQAEGRAIQHLFGAAPPPFSSTKPFTGHTLAAAGIVEAIFSIIALRERTTLPNLNWSEAMEELSIRPATMATPVADLNHVLSNSFGFGGNNVSLIFSRPA